MSEHRPDFAHIATMTERYGTFEHAELRSPRREHGYCTDDVARLLVVATREPDPTPLVRELARGALEFVTDAQGADGTCHNRRNVGGRWTDRRSVDDCWGRAVWGLGTAASQPGGSLTREALARFERGAQQRSPAPRSTAFATLGAAAVLSVDRGHQGARSLIADAVDVFTIRSDESSWRWPEARLTYANAVLPDAMIAAGVALERPALIDEGLELLAWLLDRETIDGHLSVTPVGGAGPGDPRGRFDQQPIEVATLADACARAAALTGERIWLDAVSLADAWFDGHNDSGTVMWDPETGGGYDGLEASGRNLNQGAESTLALISTRQQARLLVPVTA